MQHSSGSRSSRRHAKLPTGQLADDNEVNSSKWYVAASLPSSGPLDRRCQSQLARLQHARIQRLDFTVSRRVDSSTSWLFMSATWHVGELTTHHSSHTTVPYSIDQRMCCSVTHVGQTQFLQSTVYLSNKRLSYSTSVVKFFFFFCLLVLLYIMLAAFHATAIMIWWNKDVYNKTPQGHADTRPLKMTV